MWFRRKSAKSILVLGDSHVHALIAAHRVATPDKLQRIDFVISRLEQGKRNEKVPGMPMAEALRHAERLETSDLIAFAPRGNHYNMIGLLRHPVPFQVVESNREHGAGLQVIPTMQLIDFFTVNPSQGYGAQILKLRRATRAPAVWLETPPPKADEAHIRTHAEAAFRKAGLADAGVAPAELRLSLWRLQQQAARQFCSQFDIRYFPAPPESMDVNGFLRVEYYARDATHANPGYGQLVLEQLAGFRAQGT